MPYVRIKNVDLYYETHGQGDPILLIPGLASDAGTFAHFIPSVDSNFKLIVVENRGSGRSSKPSGQYTTEIMADEAMALLDQLGIQRVHLIGKSMGGMIAQIIAAKRPELVRSLVLACTLMAHDGYGKELLEIGRVLAQGAGLFETYRLAFLLSYSREYCMTNRGRLVEAQRFLEQASDGDELLRGYIAQSIACEKHDSTQVVGKIKAPTLVVVGNDDQITTADHSRRLAAAIANSTLKIFPRGGHGFWREFPQSVNPVVRDFLESQ
jgi:pimeloyl-ACP methyl ester carboxylesterase